MPSREPSETGSESAKRSDDRGGVPKGTPHEGGKGVATTFGVLLGLAPIGATLLVVLFLAAVAIGRYVSVASLLAAAFTAPILLSIGYSAPTVLAGFAMSVLVAVRHRDNIRRLRFGTEPRVGIARPTEVDSGVA